jgi:hypothetical protein
MVLYSMRTLFTVRTFLGDISQPYLSATCQSQRRLRALAAHELSWRWPTTVLSKENFSRRLSSVIRCVRPQSMLGRNLRLSVRTIDSLGLNADAPLERQAILARLAFQFFG